MGFKKPISYQVAYRLKGFHSGQSFPHDLVYTNDKEIYSIFNCPTQVGLYPAPEQAHVREWLRQKYDIHIRIIYETFHYNLKAVHYKNHHHFLEFNESFQQHGEALNKGLIEALELIKRHNLTSHAESEAKL